MKRTIGVINRPNKSECGFPLRIVEDSYSLLSQMAGCFDFSICRAGVFDLVRPSIDFLSVYLDETMWNSDYIYYIV